VGSSNRAAHRQHHAHALERRGYVRGQRLVGVRVAERACASQSLEQLVDESL